MGILAAGLAASIWWGNVLKRQALDSWGNNAEQTAQSLSASLFGWMEESYSSLSGFAALYENSEDVTENEFLNAFDSIEARANAFFLDEVAVARPANALEARKSAVFLEGTAKSRPPAISGNQFGWTIQSSSNPFGILSIEGISNYREFFDKTLTAAAVRKGRFVLGPPVQDMAGDTVSIAALITESNNHPIAVLGLLNFNSILLGLKQVHLPPGVSVSVSGKFPDAENRGKEVQVFNQTDQDTLITHSTRTISAEAELIMRWHFNERFQNGPDLIIGQATMLAGSIISLLISGVLLILLRQNATIRKTVRERTARLSEQETLLRSAMENMSDGMFMLDENMRFVLMNNRYREFMGFDEEFIDVGTSVENAVLAHAIRGDYGEGDADELIRHRLEVLGNSEPAEREMRLADGSKVLQLRKAPIDGGGAVVVISDVTDVSTAQEGLKRSEEEVRLILESIGEGVFGVDLEGRVSFANPRALELLGYNVDELVGQKVHALIHHSRPDGSDYPVEECPMWRAYSTGVASQIDNEVLWRKGGAPFPVEYSATPIRRGDEVAGAVVAFNDVSERRIAENRLKSVIDTASDGIVVIDGKGNLLTFSPAAERMFGYKADEVLGENVRLLMPEPDRRRHDSYIQHFHDTGERRIVGTNREVTGLRKDGSKFPMDLAIGEATIGDEQIFTGIIRDITERKEIEDKIRRQEGYLRAIIDNIPMVIILKDKEGRHLTVNSYYEVATGMPPEKVLGLRDDEFLPEEIGKPIQEMDRKIMAAGEPKTFEESVPDPNGKMRDYLTTKAPILGLDGQSETLVIAALDITERKEAESKLSEAYDVISSSIRYASRIQQAVLTGEEMLRSVMSDYFVIWEPRDVVGGDIYWCRPWGQGILVIAADCTGHGVPGAFMTLIAAGALDRGMGEVEPGQLGALIRRMHLVTQFTLNQHGGAGGSDDGLELSACFIDIDTDSLVYSGARLPMYIVENSEVMELKGTKSGIGYRGIPPTQEFEEISVALRGGQRFYMVTDGLIDQIGGERRRTFGKKRLKALLLDIQDLPFDEQKQKIVSDLADFQGGETRRDDVTVLGFKP